MNPSSLPPVYLLTFANRKWTHAPVRIRQEAETMGIFEDIFVTSETDLDPEFWEKHRNFMTHPSNARGFGFYIWKPQIILQTLQRIPANAVLLFVDAGCQLCSEGVPRLREYVRMVSQHPSGILGFDIVHSVEDWTKADTLAYYQLTPEERRAPQHASGIILFHNTPAGRAFVQHWRDDCEHYELVCDQPTGKYPTHPNFRDHRHDQSVYSILFNRYQCCSLLDETWWEPNWDKNKHYPVHARRLRG